MELAERLNKLLEHSGLNAKSFSEKIGLERPQAIYDIQKGKTKSISPSMESKIISVFSEINKAWLLTGEGEMLKIEDSENAQHGKRIPFYDDVSSVGGSNEIVASVDGVSQPTDYIDTGDWFKGATAAIRYYGASMVEYPSGCILALKEVAERQLVIWGHDYVIETNEFRITKRVQRGKDEKYIKAYSSNTEQYTDGTLIHEPLDIEWKDVNRIFLVLGYVVKKNGGTLLFSNQK